MIHGDTPNFRVARGTPMAPLLTKTLKRTLKPIFATHVHRITMPLRENSTRIDMALDEVKHPAGSLK